MIAISLEELPEELLRSILSFLPAQSLASVELTSRRFRDLANDPLLWRQCCDADFDYWEQESSPFHKKFQGKLQLPSIDASQWKRIFINRIQQDSHAKDCLERVISKRQYRIEEMQKVANCGYDAKALLLRNCEAPDTADDVLARRYWSSQILNAMQRRKGIRIWKEATRQGNQISLEEAIGAFDMFVLDTREGDVSEISTRLDQLAGRLRAETPDLENMSTRQRALEITRFIRSQDLTGVHSEEDYHILRCRFIGIALFDDEHQALPLISVAIYCSIAQRLGVNAHPCNIPFHVHAVVKSEKGYSLDGKKMHSEDAEERMFMDPFRQDEEVPEYKLRELLNSIGATGGPRESLLGISSIGDIVLRTARNIATAVQSGETTDPHSRSALSSWNTGLPDTEGAFYAGIWSMILFEPRRQNYLNHLLQSFRDNFLVDVDLLENTIFPLFRDAPGSPVLLNIIEQIRAEDRASKPIKQRTPEMANVKYRVGQTFEHRRYQYEGAIIGWDNHCDASEAWIRQMNVDTLESGRSQSFYNVLVQDRSERYVAEENIGIFTHEPSSAMMNLAGQYFKRWDEKTGAFISNIKDQYPDD